MTRYCSLLACRRLLWLGVLAAWPLVVHAQQDDNRDLRQFALGMSVAALPSSGYTDFSCTDRPAQHLPAWSAWQECPATPQGLRGVSFRYDEHAAVHVSDATKGTKVAGHPVRLALYFSKDAQLKGILIETDPKARLYLRKKAFLLADQAKSRFGPTGWQCRSRGADATRIPIGGVFIDQDCEKTTATRHFILAQRLYRPSGGPIDAFVSETRLLIETPPAP
jgi:hypothetical protein